MIALQHDPEECESKLCWWCPICHATRPYRCGDQRPICPFANGYIRDEALWSSGFVRPKPMWLRLKSDNLKQEVA